MSKECSRRDFLRLGVGAVAGVFLASCAHNASPERPTAQPQPEIPYQPEIKPAEVEYLNYSNEPERTSPQYLEIDNNDYFLATINGEEEPREVKLVLPWDTRGLANKLALRKKPVIGNVSGYLPFEDGVVNKRLLGEVIQMQPATYKGIVAHSVQIEKVRVSPEYQDYTVKHPFTIQCFEKAREVNGQHQISKRIDPLTDEEFYMIRVATQDHSFAGAYSVDGVFPNGTSYKITQEHTHFEVNYSQTKQGINIGQQVETREEAKAILDGKPNEVDLFAEGCLIGQMVDGKFRALGFVFSTVPFVRVSQ